MYNFYSNSAKTLDTPSINKFLVQVSYLRVIFLYI